MDHRKPTVLTFTTVPSDGVIAVLQLQNNFEYCSVKTAALSHPFPRAIMAACTAQISCMQSALFHVMAFIQQSC